MTYYTPENGAVVDSQHFSMGWVTVPEAKAIASNWLSIPTSPTCSLTRSSRIPFKPTPRRPPVLFTGASNRLVLAGRKGRGVKRSQIGSVALVSAQSINAEKTLSINRVRQNKDSRMLCLDGDPEAYSRTEPSLPSRRWRPARGAPPEGDSASEHGPRRAACRERSEAAPGGRLRRPQSRRPGTRGGGGRIRTSVG